MGANTRQVAGDHYVRFGEFQVWDAWWHWDLDAFQANIIKYVIRTKGNKTKRLEDLEKANHYLQKYRELLEQQLESQKADLTDAPWGLSQLQEDIVFLVAVGEVRDKLDRLVVIQPLLEQLIDQVRDEAE